MQMMPHVMALAMSPYLKWGLIIGGILVLVALTALGIYRFVSHRRYDRELEEEMQREESLRAPLATDTASVIVVPNEVLPREGETIFMPVPASLSNMTDFITEKTDGVMVRSCIRVEDAITAMTNEDAQMHCRVMYRPIRVGENCAYVALDTISGAFAPYSYINLAILKQNKLVEETVDALKIVGSGVLRKPLMIEANSFTPEALKMIALVGGRAIEVRPTKKQHQM